MASAFCSKVSYKSSKSWEIKRSVTVGRTAYSRKNWMYNCRCTAWSSWTPEHFVSHLNSFYICTLLELFHAQEVIPHIWNILFVWCHVKYRVFTPPETLPKLYHLLLALLCGVFLLSLLDSLGVFSSLMRYSQ